MNNPQVAFRRIRGRIIPIKVKKSDENKALAAVGAGAVGAGLAADAARTRTVYTNATSGLEIVRKKFAIQPFTLGIGSRLELTKRGVKAGTASIMLSSARDTTIGKKAGQVNYGFKPNEIGKFSWLGVKSKFRGQGLSEVLSKQGAIELKDMGAHSIFQHVVHPGSMRTQFSRANDTLWKTGRTLKSGDFSFKKVTKSDALKNINFYRNKKNVLTSDIFRSTSLSKLKAKRQFVPYMNTKTKIQLGLGLALGTAALGTLAYLRSKKNEQR